MSQRTEYPTAKELTLALGGTWSETRNRGKTKCPAHDDARPSLDIEQKGDCTVVICRAGCKQDALLDTLRSRGLWPERPRANGHDTRAKGKAQIVATYDYVSADGTLLSQVVRLHPKDFRQRRPDGKGGWEWKAGMVVPYRLPALLEAIASERPVFVVEGEKDTDNLARLGIVATCNAGGAGKWTREHAAHLKGADVIIIPDNDQPGRDHAQGCIATSLTGVARRVRILELPGLPAKGDVSDWIEAGGTAEQLWALVEQHRIGDRVSRRRSRSQPHRRGPRCVARTGTWSRGLSL